jgi:hypothetical protein
LSLEDGEAYEGKSRKRTAAKGPREKRKHNLGNKGHKPLRFRAAIRSERTLDGLRLAALKLLGGTDKTVEGSDKNFLMNWGSYGHRQIQRPCLPACDPAFMLHRTLFLLFNLFINRREKASWEGENMLGREKRQGDARLMRLKYWFSSFHMPLPKFIFDQYE